MDMNEMKAPLDDFFISLSEWEHVGVLRTVYVVMFVLGFGGFIVYWFAALGAWFAVFGNREKSRRGLFVLWNPFDPSWKEFYRAMLKGVLWWLLGGWPLILMGLGLVGSEALNSFLGTTASVSQ